MPTINNTVQLHKEILHNLDIMEKSLRQGKAIDIGFIEIFANDIEELKSANFDKTKIAKLSNRLEAAASKIYDLAEATLFTPVNPDEVRPLVGDPQSLSDLAKVYSKSDVKIGLEKLDSHCKMVPIAQDGHCLFRAVATSVFEHIRKSEVPVQKSFFERLHAEVQKLKTEDPELETLYKNLLSEVNQVAEKKKTIHDVLRTRSTSDLLVKFLRHLACAYNKKHSTEVLDSFMTTTSGTKEKYLIEMLDMKKATYGDEPELRALSNTLGLDFRPIDVLQVGKGQLQPDSFFVDHKPNSAYLLYRPGHYDVALRA